MADLSVTAASVVPSSTATITRGTAGATITAGQLVYRDSSDGTIKLADANASAPANSVAGIAVNGASAGQPVNYVTEDSALAMGAILTAGVPYFLSATPGAICVAGDLSAMTTIFVGVAVSTSVLNFKPVAGGAHA